METRESLNERRKHRVNTCLCRRGCVRECRVQVIYELEFSLGSIKKNIFDLKTEKEAGFKLDIPKCTSPHTSPRVPRDAIVCAACADQCSSKFGPKYIGHFWQCIVFRDRGIAACHCWVVYHGVVL